jgi:uncharacterized protein YunC (DUF1805 family)
VSGRTEQTNSQKTFILETVGPEALVKLGRFLDYESISEYMLTVRVQNKYDLAATTTVNIQVEDVNDNIPAFTEVVRGSVLENEPPGAPVMQVRAIDADGTEANNQVRWENILNVALDKENLLRILNENLYLGCSVINIEGRVTVMFYAWMSRMTGCSVTPHNRHTNCDICPSSTAHIQFLQRRNMGSVFTPTGAY